MFLTSPVITRFWTLILGAGSDKGDILPEIVDLARSKLLCHHKINLKHTDRELEAAALTAVLNMLLTLDFESQCEVGHDREAAMVASHMRIAFSVPHDCAYLRSGYPSEPILAEAAARQMEQFQILSCPDHDTCIMAEMLKSEFSSGLLDKGHRGEVVFRVLISEAYRRAVYNDYPTDSPHNFSKGCRLTTFIQKLFSKDYTNQILCSIPDNVKDSTTFAQAFQNAIIHFTHFRKMANDMGPTTIVMLAAFVRCMVIICWSSQDVVDMLLPMLLNGSNKIQECNMTAIMLQIKLRKMKGSVIWYEINQKNTSNLTDVHPYITLVAKLGVQVPIPPVSLTETKVRLKLDSCNPTTASHAPTTPKKTTSTRSSEKFSTPSKLHIPAQPQIQSHPRDVHPHYSIFAYGCSETVYGVVSKSDRSVYKFLLGHRDVLNEHPRRDDEMIQAMRTMKPFWSAREAGFGWIDVPFLQKCPEWIDDDGVVYIG